MEIESQRDRPAPPPPIVLTLTLSEEEVKALRSALWEGATNGKGAGVAIEIRNHLYQKYGLGD